MSDARKLKSHRSKTHKKSSGLNKLDFTRLKSDLGAIFKKSTNGNKNARAEQIKAAALIIGVGMVCLGLYYWDSKPVVVHHKKEHHFAGVFSGNVDQDYDHERVIALQNQIDKTNSALSKMAKEKAQIAQGPISSDSRLAKQIEILQREVAALKAAKAKVPAHRLEHQDNHHSSDQQQAFSQAPTNRQQYLNKTNTPPTEPMINIGGIDDVIIHYPDAKRSERNPSNYVWAGTFANGYLLTGIIGDAGTNATKNTGTVAIRLIDNGTMPNDQHSHLNGCTVLASTYGDLSADTAVVHLETLSCAGKKYSFEKKVYGSVFDLDAFQDLRGQAVLKAKPILGYAAVAGLISGIGQGISSSGQTTQVTGAGVVSTPTSAMRSGIGQGISKPADKITDYLMQIANLYHPIVRVHAGRKVIVLFQAGFWIDKKHQDFESMKSIDTGKSVSHTSTHQGISLNSNHFNQEFSKEVAGASGQVVKAARAKATEDFAGKLQSGGQLFSPIEK